MDSTAASSQAPMDRIRKGDFEKAKPLLSADFQLSGPVPERIEGEAWLGMSRSLKKVFQTLPAASRWKAWMATRPTSVRNTTIEKDEMKKQNRIYIALGVVLMASLACAVGGTAPSTEGGQPSTIATAVPTQEAGSTTGAPVPESIDLTNPALYIVPNAPAYRFDSMLKMTGVDTAGSPKEFLSHTLLEIQTQPQIMQHVLSEGDLMAGSPSDAPGSISIPSSDTVIIGDQMTSAQMVGISGAAPKLVCHTGPTSNVQGPGLLESTLAFMPKLQAMITGQAQGVESGVEINGVITDKYELSADNFTKGGGDVVSAFVYVARDGGFITRFEEQLQTKMTSSGFDPNQVADGSATSNYFLVEDGSLDIAVPAACNK